jgi:hypothetical protein
VAALMQRILGLRAAGHPMARHYRSHRDHVSDFDLRLSRYMTTADVTVAGSGRTRRTAVNHGQHHDSSAADSQHSNLGSAGNPRVTSLQCTVAGADVVGFGHHARDDYVRLYVRDAMYRIIEEAFADSGIALASHHYRDLGDGVFILVPPHVPAAMLVAPLFENLQVGLRQYNKTASDAARIRLRIALHAGQVYLDQHGVTGPAIIHLFRLLDAPAFKRVFTATMADTAMLASGYLYDTVIRHGVGIIDPGSFTPLNVASKETRTQAWLRLPASATHGLTGGETTLRRAN